MDVTIDKESNTKFNEHGSAILSTKENSLDDGYEGYMQIYLWDDLQHIVVKIDNSDDRYAYSTPELDEDGNPTDQLLVNSHFTFELEHDGSGGYKVKIRFANNQEKVYTISARDNAKVQDFDKLYYSLPEGIHVNVKFERLITNGLLVGCTNLTKIVVDPANPTFKSCDHGVLYNKDGYYVIRIPEGGTDSYEIPSKVIRLYPGAIHGVKANVVLHSNPEIGVVEGHEDDVKNVKFHLSLNDIDKTIEDDDTGYGGARNFNSGNQNTYLTARYERTALAAGAYGTITLPFVPTTGIENYDFFEFVEGDNTSLTFLQVSQLKANTPYLYKLKDGVTATTGNDVFATDKETTIAYMAPYTPDGTWKAVGTYTNDAVITKDYPNNYYYYYSASRKEFLRVTEKLNYRPYRAFFVKTTKANEDNIEQAATLSLRFKDGSTQVIAPSQVEGWKEEVYYDLMGRRVMKPTNGIYIVNGKKVIL